MKVLLEVEAQTLAEGSEWTRQRLEERLQAQADQIGALCPQSGLVLKYVRMREFSLMTCVGIVKVRAAYGFSSAMQRWLSPAREQWGLTAYERVSPQLQQKLCYTATQTGSYQKAARSFPLVNERGISQNEFQCSVQAWRIRIFRVSRFAVSSVDCIGISNAHNDLTNVKPLQFHHNL